MPRRPRYYFPGAIYHIILRGNNKRPIFQSDAEHHRFLQLLQDGVESFDHEIFAYCLMTNHVHLAVRVHDTHPSKIFQSLASRYTQYFHWKHETSGHLFQGRFKSIPVDGSSYFRELIRYVHLNPVRAGMVDDPKAYRWSSHSAYLDDRNCPWLAMDFTMEHFSSPAALDRFVLAGIRKSEPIDFTNGIVGDADFLRLVQQRTGKPVPIRFSLESLISTVSNEYGIELEELRGPRRNMRISHIRAVAGYLAKDLPGITLREVAKFFGCDHSSASRAVSRLAKRMEASPALRAEVETLRTKILPL